MHAEEFFLSKGTIMSFAGNVIWFVLGGWYTALIWLIGSAIFAISIIGLPLTRAGLEMTKMSAWPFGKEIVHIRELDQREMSGVTAATGTIGFIANIVWAATFGIALFFAYLLGGILCCFTIIGIPFGLQAFKLAAISIWPVGRRVVTNEVAQLVRKRKAEATLTAHAA